MKYGTERKLFSMQNIRNSLRRPYKGKSLKMAIKADVG